jgi:hypothetical protein
MADEWDHAERRTRADRRARFEEITADLSERLRALCSEMAPAEFKSLVGRMARVQLRYEPESATWNR